jgi:hypothetical protein
MPTDKEQYGHLRVTHFDGKFGVARLKNDAGNLAPDEPVFVFRGSDKHMPAVLRYYAMLCEADRGDNDEHVESVLRAKREAMRWQEANPGKVKAPD